MSTTAKQNSPLMSLSSSTQFGELNESPTKSVLLVSEFSPPVRPMSSITYGSHVSEIRKFNITSAPSSPLGGNIVTPSFAVFDDIISSGIPKFSIGFDPIEPIFINYYLQSMSSIFFQSEKSKIESMLQRSLLRSALYYEDQGMLIIALE